MLATVIRVMRRRVIAFIRLGRPLFLIGGFALYGLGAAVAVYLGAKLSWPRFAWGQIAITSTQLMTHYCNDYFDLAADRANTTPTRWSGGSRVLPGGDLSPAVALIAALALAGLALAATGRLTVSLGAGPLTAPLLLAAVVLSWEYSAPPLRLCARGLGELNVALVVSCLTPFIAFYLQTGKLMALPFLVVTPLCCAQFAMLLAIEFPDAIGDAAAGKRTLVVRFGAAWGAKAYQASLLTMYGLLPLLVGWGLPGRVALGTLGTAPIGAWQIWRMHRGAWRDPGRWESVAFWTVALLVSTTVAELGAFLVLRDG
jgi:1,4-dihydroxy-2-naphthoate octaprenyltransferase